jgi:hypothetical protein
MKKTISPNMNPRKTQSEILEKNSKVEPTPKSRHGQFYKISCY